MPYVIRKTKNADGSVEIEKYYTARRTQREKPVKKTGKIIDRLRQLVSGDFANESEKIVKDEEGSTDELIEKLLFFKLFTAPCCTLFTTIFKIIPNATSHYSSPILHIKYCYPKTKHII